MRFCISPNLNLDTYREWRIRHIISTGGPLRLERDLHSLLPARLEILIPLQQMAPETQGQHSAQPREMTQTFQTLGRQHTQSCTGRTPAGKAERKCFWKGTVYTAAPCTVVPCCWVRKQLWIPSSPSASSIKTSRLIYGHSFGYES